MDRRLEAISERLRGLTFFNVKFDGRRRRRFGEALVLVGGIALLEACRPLRQPRLVPEGNVITITPEVTRARLEGLRKLRPDCVIEPTSEAIDNEIKDIAAGKKTYDPLPDPKNQSDKDDVLGYRAELEQEMKNRIPDIEALNTTKARAAALSSFYKVLAEAEDDLLQEIRKNKGGMEIQIELLDLKACHRVKAETALAYGILNP